MVNFLHCYELTFLEANLTQRMFLDITVTDTLPGSAISTAYSRVTVVLLIAFGFQLCVFLAEPSIC